MVFWQILGALLGILLFLGFGCMLYDIIKEWKKLCWTQRCYKIIIMFGVLLASIRVVYLGFTA